MAQEKISVYNLADLKNTSDDALPNYLNSLKFKQSHTLVDIRLAIGYSAFAVSAACFLWDFKFGFNDTKYITAFAVLVYSCLNGALTLWMWLKEKNIVYEGFAPSGEKISISTSTPKNAPIYNLSITLTTPSSLPPSTITISRSFTEWFDVTGTFIATPFQSMLASSVELIGKFDPKRIADTTTIPTPTEQAPDVTPEMLDAVLAATGAEGATPGKKGGKRRKA